MEAAADAARAIAGGLLGLSGVVCILAGTIGLLRFPDFYARLHGARVADGVGSVLVLIALAILSGDVAIAVRLLLLTALMAALAPTLSHMAANAAHTGGLAPLVGRYTAPRPGARRAEP